MTVKDYLNSLNERLVIVLIWTMLAILWAFDAVNSLSFFLIGGIMTFFMMQFEYRVRLLALRNGRRKAKAKKSRMKMGVMSVRAQALNNLPTPIMIIAENYSISFANAAASDIMNQDLEDQDVFLYLRQPEIVSAIMDAVDHHQKSEKTLRYNTADERSFDVSIQPISKKNSIKNGRAIIFFYEVTRLLQTEQMRVDFVANASHELKTPLASIMGFIETLQGPAKDDPEAAERFLGIMQRESERMSRLIADLLSLSRIEMERHRVPTEEVNVEAMIKHVVSSLVDKAAGRQITLQAEADAQLPKVLADSDQLLQVLLNLVSNACKYADEATVVHVGAVLTKSDTVKFFIRDEGPGIAPEHLVRLTERFYRVDTARSRKMGGTGLGLAIVKHILLRHNSRLDIESTVPNGTTFSFELTPIDQ